MITQRQEGCVQKLRVKLTAAPLVLCAGRGWLSRLITSHEWWPINCFTSLIKSCPGIPEAVMRTCVHSHAASERLTLGAGLGCERLEMLMWLFVMSFLGVNRKEIRKTTEVARWLSPAGQDGPETALRAKRTTLHSARKKETDGVTNVQMKRS